MFKSLPEDWSSLSLKAKIGQTIVVRASGHLFDRQIRYPSWEAPARQLQTWLQDLQIGGVILLGGSAAEISLRTQQLQDWADIPLLIAADVEEGVGQRFEGATWFPPPMSLGEIAEEKPALAEQYAQQMGSITAREALAIGINWLFAPVVDVNNNPDNPVINVRAFGDRPEIVSHLAAAFIRGTQQSAILSTAKHFPGHGDTASDSHLNLPAIPHDSSRLNSIELPPFQAAIAAGVDSIMTAHLMIPTWDACYPATLSPAILTEQLRQNLGFEGLIVTDALIMGGVANYASQEEIAVLAVEAGADILLMPADPVVAIEAVYQAVRSGRISEARIDASVERIWQAKQKVFNSQSSSANKSTAYFLAELDRPQAYQTAKDILRDSLQVSGDRVSPSKDTRVRKSNLILVDDWLNTDFLGRHTPAVKIPQQMGYELLLTDRHNLVDWQQAAMPSLLQVFIRGNPFRGIAGLEPTTQQWLKELLQSASLEAVAIYGSPYILDWFKDYLSRDVSWVFTYGQMYEAQAIALNSLFDLSTISDLTPETFL